MIFIHLLLGILLGNLFGKYLFFIIGSIFPDLDHLYILLKNKITPKKIIDSIKFEKKYNTKYKTPFLHSLLGLILFSGILYMFNQKGGLIFAAAYFLHLLIDWIDIDEKYYLYPLKVKFKGFLPIWSKTERVATIILLLIIAINL